MINDPGQVLSLVVASLQAAKPDLNRGLPTCIYIYHIRVLVYFWFAIMLIFCNLLWTLHIVVLLQRPGIKQIVSTNIVLPIKFTYQERPLHT